MRTHTISFPEPWMSYATQSSGNEIGTHSPKTTMRIGSNDAPPEVTHLLEFTDAKCEHSDRQGTAQGISIENVTATYFSGRASFRRDVDEEFANKNSEMRTNEEETKGALQKHTYLNQTIQRNTEMLFRKRWALSFHNIRVPSVIVCLMCSLRRVDSVAERSELVDRHSQWRTEPGGRGFNSRGRQK